MTEPPDAERDERAGYADPRRRLRGRRAREFASHRIMRSRNPAAFAALLGAQALIAIGWVIAPPSGRRTRGVVVNTLGVAGYAAWWWKSGG